MPAETHSHRSPVDANEVERIVCDQLVEILGVDPDAVSRDTRLREDLDDDDFALIDLVEAVETELGDRSVGLTIDDDDLVELRTVGDAIDCVIAQIEAARG
jgi:acyl carrier protein